MTWILLLSGFLELWPAGAGENYYQHRMGATVEAVATIGIVEVRPWLGMTWWGRPDALIPSSFLNLEASRAIERTYGVAVLLGITNCKAGAGYWRRGVEELDRRRVWGQYAMELTHKYSLGYADAVYPIAICGPIRITGPPLIRTNWPLTLPEYYWHIFFKQEANGYVFQTYLGLGGPRGAYPSMNIEIDRKIARETYLGVAAGVIEPPGWGPSLMRFAAIMRFGCP